jgi:hypothetical protein
LPPSSIAPILCCLHPPLHPFVVASILHCLYPSLHSSFVAFILSSAILVTDPGHSEGSLAPCQN